MFNLLKNVFTKEWIAASVVRALKTFAQSLISMLGADQIGLLEANWTQALSVAAMACVLSLLTSVYGLPEVNSIKAAAEIKE